MKKILGVLYAFVTATLVVACGSGDGSNVNYRSAPTVTSAKATPSTSASSIVLSATATDNVGIAAYCFSTSSSKPKASDSCFQTSSSKVVPASSAVGQYYVWAKNALGIVSDAAATMSPCSSAGIAASHASQSSTVCMFTSLGEMVFELETARAPVTVNNFLQYVNSGFYTDLVFHRIMSTFMVQGGGFTYSTTSGLAAKTPTYPAIPLEAIGTTGLSNLNGTLAMARTSDVNSATSQFFVNVVDNISLDTTGGGYAVFGRIISGLDTLNSLKTVTVKDNGSGETSLPNTPPIIRWAVQLK